MLHLGTGPVFDSSSLWFSVIEPLKDRKKMDEMDNHFQEIIKMALKNADAWVRVIAEILKFYPRKFQFQKCIGSVDMIR